jgi:2-hydroxymuconate-semialdehyde hydrolase
MNASNNPEISLRVRTGDFHTNVHDLGHSVPGQPPVLFIHGSGPGVSAWANWRLALAVISQQRRVIAPDMVGFGYSDRPTGITYNMDTWVQQALDLLDVLELPQVDLVGNSFGGALSLALAIRAPKRVRRLVLMGSVGVPFAITPGLDAVWGYEPSLAAMKDLLKIFAHSRGLVNDELAQLRYDASVRPGFQESFSAMFPAPRQRWVNAMTSPEAAIRALPHETLIVHGREDKVIPLQNSLTLSNLIPNSQLHVFGQCGHWTQIEHAARFARMVGDFFNEADAS